MFEPRLVKKWVAGFAWLIMDAPPEVVTFEIEVRETARQYQLDHDDLSPMCLHVVEYKSHINKTENLLHDTEQEALLALIDRLEKQCLVEKNRWEKTQEKLYAAVNLFRLLQIKI